MSGERNPYAGVRRAGTRCPPVNLHELQKQEILKQGNDGGDYNFSLTFNSGAQADVKQPTQVAKQGNDAIGFEDWELYFDSVYKNPAKTDLPNGEISFSIAELTQRRDISNIIQMHIGEFYFPRLRNPDPIPGQVPNAPDLYFYRRMYILVRDLPFGQTVLAEGSNQYHWEMQIEDINSISVRMVPIKKSFFLQRPLQRLDELDLQFMLPIDFRPVPLVQDNYPVEMALTTSFAPIVPIPPSNPARFRLTDTVDGSGILNIFSPPLPVGAAIPAIPAPGIAVFMSGAQFQDAGETVNNTVSNLVNNPSGLFVTAVVDVAIPPQPPRYQFEIADIDGTLGNTIVTAGGADFRLVIGSRRFAIPIRFTCVRSQVTNYISVYHD